jgi:DNA-binding transcriptional LysR family regulator
MELQYLFEFCILAEIGNFLEAADELDMSQSTLSRHINALETDLGAPLFIRTTRQVKISGFGKILLPYARQMLQMEQNLFNDFAKENKSIKNIISIGSIPAIAQYDITTTLVRFQKDNPTYTFEITESESADLKKKIKNETLDFAFIRELDDSGNEFAFLPYKSDRLVAIMPATHPLGTSKSLCMEDLRNESFLLLPEGTLMHEICINECMDAGFMPKICYTSSRADNIIDLVAKGMGVALLNRIPVAPLLASNTVIIDIVPAIETQIDLIYLKDKTMTKASKTFLTFIKELLHLPD